MRNLSLFSVLIGIAPGAWAQSATPMRIFEEPPITSTQATVASLLLTLALIYWVTGSSFYKSLPVLKVVPAVFLVYFVPMVLNTLGLFDGATTAGIYNFLKVTALPMSLVLLLVGTDVPLVARLGPRAILIMVLASVGVVVGGVVAFVATQGLIDDPDLWRGMGALAGSWIGGSANMIAAKEALACPQRVFTPMTIIDVVCGYGWMIVILAFAGSQAGIDKWNRAKTSIIEEINEHLGKIHAQRAKPITTPALLSMLGVSSVVASLCLLSGSWLDDTLLNMPSGERRTSLEALMTPADWDVFAVQVGELTTDTDASDLGALTPEARMAWLASVDGSTDGYATLAMRKTLRARGMDPDQVERPLHALGQVVNYLALMLIFASIVGLILSFSPLRRLEDSGASEVGYTLLFLTLTSIGARADLNDLIGQGWYLLLGTIWIAIFALTLFLLLKIFRAPIFLVATASMGNIGGTVSAPIVAGAYQPNLAVVGVLMAVIGQAVGTFLAIGTGWICSLLAAG